MPPGAESRGDGRSPARLLPVTGTPRSALVTGASKGIGRSIASRLAASGYAVTGTYRSGGVPDGVLGVSADITDPEQLEQAFVAAEQAHGPVEVLVCNAGITADGLLMRMSDEQWDSVIATNLTASFKLVRRASRSMIKGRFGRIVFVSSVVALLGSAGQANYETKTIRPKRPLIIDRLARRTSLKEAVRLVAITESHCSSLMRMSSPSAVMPALHTRTSTGPCACSAATNACSSCSGSVMSALTPRTPSGTPPDRYVPVTA